MGKLFKWLDRGRKETIREYDNRIDHLQAFHAGYAFLSLCNYSPVLEAFSAFCVWNGEFNKKLENPLPAAGFMLHCAPEEAHAMCSEPAAFPLFVKLISRRGRLFTEGILLLDRDRVFDFYFNGCGVIPPENTDLVFAGYRTPEARQDPEPFFRERPADQAGSYLRKHFPGGGSYGAGSYRIAGLWSGSYSLGSYRIAGLWSGSYSLGSYRIAGWESGSYSLGSYRIAGLWSGSYSLGSYRIAGWESGSYSLGSYRIAGWESGSYSVGSYRTTGWSGAGSYPSLLGVAGSYPAQWSGGSFGMARLGTGSYTGGHFRVLSLPENRFTDMSSGGQGTFLYLEKAFAVRRLIEEMGYGLDLI